MNQKQFETDYKILLKSYGIDYNKELEAEVKTNLGNLYIKCLDGWIAMRFLDKDFSVSNFYAKFSKDEPLNNFSFKYNIHSFDNESCSEELDNRLNALIR